VESAIFLFTRRVLAFFRVNLAKIFNQPNFVNPGRLFLSIVGSSSGKPGETGTGGGRKKNRKIGEFFFRGILQPTTGHRLLGTQTQMLWLTAWVWLSLTTEFVAL